MCEKCQGRYKATVTSTDDDLNQSKCFQPPYICYFTSHATNIYNAATAAGSKKGPARREIKNQSPGPPAASFDSSGSLSVHNRAPKAARKTPLRPLFPVPNDTKFYSTRFVSLPLLSAKRPVREIGSASLGKKPQDERKHLSFVRSWICKDAGRPMMRNRNLHVAL
jgi:hypothetical protein